MLLNAKWTDDCQGKKDYDGDILSISTRYYPRGGGFFIIQDGQCDGNEARPEIKPSAASQLLLWHCGSEGYTVLRRAEFEGETFEDVKVQVEAWAQEQMTWVVDRLRAETENKMWSLLADMLGALANSDCEDRRWNILHRRYEELRKGAE